MKTRLLFFFIAISSANWLNAQDNPKKEYFAGECSKTAINVDGKLNEQVWINAIWMDDFVQYEPSEGKKPHQKTEFAILLDENYLYAGFKCWDTSADSIVQRLTRRDDTDGDFVALQLDSYFDRRTAFSFIVNAAGIKNDFIISNDGGNEDNTWDPIWMVKTSRDQSGWYAEMKIPLTQLRFEGGTEQTWGLQIGRRLFRKQETSLWQQSSKKVAGWVSQYGELKGLKNLKSRKVADFTPYVVARTDRFEKEPENPFRSSGHRNQLDAGLDGKIGLTNNLTLDFTINPDFGQVEADPSQVNLTSFETFFQEKRPFFIEGKNILNFQLNFGDGDLASENLFYSRRIGRRPHLNPDLNDNEYKKSPEFTSIIGAAKVTGKTKTGWSVGLLESLTSEEFARISNGHERTEMIEPFTNYTIGRVQKDFDKGNTMLGGMITSVNRNITEEQLNYLHKAAYTGGIDLVHKWHNKDWEFDFSSYFSRVEGSPTAISETQKSWIHNFQRPDAKSVKYDPTRTSLMGQGGKVVLGKYGGKLKFMAATSWKSPGLELNDAGYMRMADNIMEVIWVGYRIFEPFSVFRNLNLNFNQWMEWNFAGESLGPGGNINVHTQLKNYWSFHAGTNFNGDGLSTTELRGGPALKYSGSKNVWVSFSSNEQKKITIDGNFWAMQGTQKGSKSGYSYNAGLAYRPSKNLKITVSPEFSVNRDELQYVDQFEHGTTKNYLFASIDQKTLSASIRVNYNITPDLSIQYWGQPFVSAGKYTEFKHITNGRADRYADRFQVLGANEISYLPNEEVYRVSDVSGNQLYRFDQPDFNVKEFLSNMVLRWEYKPGSTIFLVWSQTRSQSVGNGGFDFRGDLTNLFDEKPYNVLLLKMSFRLGR